MLRTKISISFHILANITEKWGRDCVQVTQDSVNSYVTLYKPYQFRHIAVDFNKELVQLIVCHLSDRP